MTDMKLYYDIRSPPARSCLMLIKMLKIDVQLIEVDIFAGEQHAEDYLKINAAHTVPTFVDSSVTLTDSHVILMYLCDKYSSQIEIAAKMWPNTFLRRTRITNLLFLDCSLVYRRDLISQIIRKTFANVEMDYFNRKIRETYDMLENQLLHVIVEVKERGFVPEDTNDENIYMASYAHITIADLVILTSISTLDAFVFINMKQFPLLYSWYNRIQKLPENEINLKGVEDLKAVMEKIGKFKYAQRNETAEDENN